MISLIHRAEVRGRVVPGTVRRRAARLLDALGAGDAELAIVLTDDAEIRDLNRAWRGLDEPTDVLSFPQIEPGVAVRPGDALGDVVISLETAARQIVADGMLPRLRGCVGDREWTLADEVTFLLVHGVLHLLGHDHHEPEETARMQAEEARLLPALLSRTSRGGKA